MSLDHINGEPNPDILGVCRVMPTASWTDTIFFNEACKAAAEAFTNAGAVWPIHIYQDDVLVQQYPNQDTIEFVFSRDIAGEEVFYRYGYTLTQAMVSELKVTGRWATEH